MRRTSGWGVACLRPTSTRRFSCPTVMLAPTFHGRLLIVQRHQAGWPQAHIAAAMGVSRKCVKTWLDRYAAEGEAGLQDRSSRPHSMPTRTSPQVEERRSSQLRRRQRCGPDDRRRDSGCRPARCRGSWPVTGCPIYGSCDPITGERDPRIASSPRSATNAPGPASWSTWTSRSSAGSPTAVAGGPWPRRGLDHRDRKHQGRVRLRALDWSTTTPGWPTPRSCPTRRAPPAPASWPRAAATSPPTASTGSSELMTDNAWAYKWSLREVCAELGHPPDLHQAPLPLAERQGRTAQPDPAHRVGLPTVSSPATTAPQQPLRPGSSTTTLNAATAHSADYHPISRLPPT